MSFPSMPAGGAAASGSGSGKSRAIEPQGSSMLNVFFSSADNDSSAELTARTPTSIRSVKVASDRPSIHRRLS